LEAEGEGMDPRNQKNKSVSFEVSSGTKLQEREKIGLEANFARDTRQTALQHYLHLFQAWLPQSPFQRAKNGE
jgi:hypothetical protein